MMRKSKAFTLIELLVVIAIIGILAAMVFPVFARARESARKAVCLSNVKNIALAVQMYLADNNDTLPPGVHDSEVLDYFETLPGGESEDNAYYPTCAFHANPYLRWPVILDEYVKNRDVWRCPSAKMQGGAAMMIPVQDWLGYLQSYQGVWGNAGDTFAYMICSTTWPAGWGGEVTDTIAQQRYGVNVGSEGGSAAANKAFVQSIATGEESSFDKKMAAIEDPVSYIIAADGGAQTKVIQVGLVAYPDMCALQCGNSACGWADWESAECVEYGADCGLYVTATSNGAFLANVDVRKPFSRHLGGVNLGFLDGHASWVNSESVITREKEGELQGWSSWGPLSTCGAYDPDGGGLSTDVPLLF
jgi:prepilin-type N-terminal cleavage/methylation domain-containing protein/prepilin-type processing-associated H-X9-DG protein